MQSINPWTQALPGPNQDITPLCQHVYNTLELIDGVEALSCRAHIPMGLTREIQKIEIYLKKDVVFSYTVKIQPAETGECILKATTILAQMIMNDALLLNGVTDFECSADGWTGSIIFHGHHVDISPFFDGKTIQTSLIVNEIIRKVSENTGDEYVCNIGMVPIRGNVAFLECESVQEQKRFYAESNILKWVSEHNTAPFTRKSVAVTDIKIHAPSVVAISDQPRIPLKRNCVEITEVSNKRSRSYKTIHVYLVWDRSGSMQSMVQESKDGLIKTIEEQRAIALSTGNTTKLTVVTFDHEIKTVVNAEDITTVDISEVEDWVKPRGTTRLYDAILQVATSLEEHVKEGESAVFVAMTDGQDTDSEVHTDDVRKTLERLKTSKDVECIFMAANIGNAQTVGGMMGFNQDTSITFTPGASAAAFDCMSQSAMRSITGGSAAFTMMERQSSVQPIQRSTFRARTVN